jgi:hypothetical protein
LSLGSRIKAWFSNESSPLAQQQSPPTIADSSLYSNRTGGSLTKSCLQRRDFRLRALAGELMPLRFSC